MNATTSGRIQTVIKGTSIDDALVYLNILISKDFFEFPDALIKTLTLYDVDQEALTASYDAQFEFSSGAASSSFDLCTRMCEFLDFTFYRFPDCNLPVVACGLGAKSAYFLDDVLVVQCSDGSSFSFTPDSSILNK